MNKNRNEYRIEYMEKVIPAIKFPQFDSSHDNKWVALSRDRESILAVGDNLSEVLEKSKNMEGTSVLKVPSSFGYAPKSNY